MENYIPVLTPNRRPLAPCHPNRAKGLVRQEKASFRHRSGIRIIILNKTKVPKLKNSSKIQLRMDPGAGTTGIAVTRNYPDGSRDALMALEITHQGKAITRRLIKRRQLRRRRRYRKTRHRMPRFDNRTRTEGWLPPSLLSRLQNTLTWVRRLAKLLPIQDIHVETSVFDPQLLRNPEIKGIEYQQGPLYQTNLRSAVFQRDGNKCVYCNRSGKRQRLEIDHAIPKSEGGPDRYDNLVAACRTCNQKRKNLPLEQWLRRRPKKLAAVNSKLGMDLASATHMNIILPNLLKELRQDGWNVTEHSAATTAAGRQVRHRQVPPWRRRRHRLPSEAEPDAGQTYHNQSNRPRKPATDYARQTRHPQGQRLPGVLQADKEDPEADPNAQPQETREASRRRGHRRPCEIQPRRNQGTWLRNDQPRTSCTDEAEVEERES